jgi:hypothetical protein
MVGCAMKTVTQDQIVFLYFNNLSDKLVHVLQN